MNHTKTKRHLRKAAILIGAVLIGLLVVMRTKIDTTVYASELKTYDTSFAVSASSRLLNQTTIEYAAVLPELAFGDDGMLYLFELQPSEYEVPFGAEPVASTPVSLTPSFTLPFAEERLYTKLGLAIKSCGQNVLIAYPQYIVNPELLATHTKPRTVRPLKSEQGKEFCNLNLSGNIKGVIAGNYTTVQVMNTGSSQLVTNPYARAEMVSADSHPVAPRYYMLNASEPQGIAAITSELKLCAQSATLENFIIGNEVNMRTWNYMMWTDWEHYVREYAQAFRVSYNAVKSQNANARVFICIDQNWDRNRRAGHREYYEYMDGKDFLAKFNEVIAKEGNIDWGVAQHPYPVPLTYAKFWDMSECRNGSYMAGQIASGKMVSFQNLSLLTDYLQRPELLSPTGNVRHVILSEVGIVNSQGADIQGAAMYASYEAAKRNPYVDEIIYLLAYSEPGIDTRLSGQSQAAYDSIGTPSEPIYETWAKSVIGINDWAEIIR